MDLPSCPTCGQSVLDDDAAECPFCGAPMSGAPAKSAPSKSPSQGAGAKASPKKPSAGAAKPTKKPAQAKSAKPSKREEVPIAADSEAAKNAIRLSPKPAKGRSHKIVCPMCESVGYASQEAAGKDVKCANPKCMVPVFTAPHAAAAATAAVADTDETEAKSSKGMMIGIGIGAAVLLIGGGAFFALKDDAPPPKPATSGGGDAYAAATGGAGGGVDVDASQPPTATSDTNPETASDASAGATGSEQAASTADSDSVIDRSLVAMVTASQQRSDNRHKPYCRRLTAVAYLLAGDQEGADAQLKQLDVIRPSVPYYKISPLVIMAWDQLAEGRREDAEKTAELAWGLSSDLPKFGQFSVDAASDLGAVLVALGRTADAQTLVARFNDSETQGQLSALQQHAYESKGFAIESDDKLAPAVPWTAPQFVAVARALVTRGFIDEALAWSVALSDKEAQAECLAEISSAVARQTIDESQPELLEQVTGQIDGLEPAIRARAYARIAAAQLQSGDADSGAKSLEAANAALGEISAPEAVGLGNVAQTAEFELPDAVPLRQGAVAAAEIARAELIQGKMDEAWTAIATALAYTRAMAPSPVIARQRVEEASRSANAVRGRLKSGLGLENDDLVRRAFNRYRNTVQAILEAASARFALQSAIVARAAEWGLGDRVLAEIKSRATARNANQQEPWISTNIPRILLAKAREEGSTLDAAEVQALARNSGAAPRFNLRQSTLKAVAAGDVSAAAGLIDRYSGAQGDRSGDKAWRTLWTLQLVSRIVEDAGADAALKFVSALSSKDIVLREEAMNLVGALVSLRGEEQPAIALARQRDLQATEKVALLNGVIRGIVARGDKPE